MRYLKLVAAIAFAFSVSANAQGDEVFIRNVCDTLASKGHEPVTLVASDLIENNWVANKTSGNWTHGTVTQKVHSSYGTLQPISKTVFFRFPLSIVAACRASENVPFKYMSWTERKWTEYKLDYYTYIFDSHALSMGDYDSTNANNFLIMVTDPPIEKDVYSSDEIMISKPFEFAFEWWFAVAEIRWKTAEGGASMQYPQSAANDSISALQAMLKKMNSLIGDSSKKIPDTISTAKIQVIKVLLKDSEKTETIIEPVYSSSVTPSSSSQSSSSFEPPKSCSPTKSSDSKPSSSSFDPPKSCSPTKSSDSKPSSSSKDESSASTPSSDSDKTSDSKASSSSKGPKGSSSSDKTSIEMVRMELVDDEVVEMRTLDGSLVKNSRNVKPGIYYAKTSRGTWFKKVILPRGE